MIFQALSEAANRDELLLVEGGMCRYHLRKDGVAVIREIIVLPEYHLRGIGRRLVDMVRVRCGGTIRAKCPKNYTANTFWKKIGFTLISDGEINVWERYP